MSALAKNFDAIIAEADEMIGFAQMLTPRAA